MTETGNQRCFNRNFGVKAASRFARGVLPFVVLIFMGADDPAKEAKKDHDLLQGEWTGVSLEMGGKESDNKEWKLYIRGDEWTVTQPGGHTLVANVVKIRPSKDPRQIDLSYKVPGGKEQSSLGIYKLDDDTLTLCRTWAPQARPKDFKTTKAGGILVVWKRVKEQSAP
jgi:uncharacterized protein (TIGR03067 family)